jgi:hypothetical protein
MPGERSASHRRADPSSESKTSVIAAATPSCRSMCTKFGRSPRPSEPLFTWNLSPESASKWIGALRRAQLRSDIRKLYAFALIDAHNRMLYVEFTHSQSFETLARWHVHAFHALQGVASEIVYDTWRQPSQNMMAA